MATKKLYGATFGPYLYDDGDAIVDPDGDFSGMTWDASVSDGLHLCAGARFLDTNQSNHLTLTWGENDTADRTFQFLVGGGNRSLTMQGNLTVELASILNQDLTTDAGPTFATLTLNSQTIADDARGLSSICKLVTNAKSDGIAGYFEGHIDGVTDGPTYGGGVWLNVDSGSTTLDIRALDIGIYEGGANCSGGNAYGLAIHMEFDDTSPPAGIYPFRINCNDTAGHATPDALIFAPNRSAIALIDAAPGTADAYLKIELQDGSVYRLMLVKE